MSIRARLRKAEKAAEVETITVPQIDGTIKRFPRSAYAEAFLNAYERLGAGEDAPPRHALLEAARNSSDPEWREYLADMDYEGATEPVEDLSVPSNQKP